MGKSIVNNALPTREGSGGQGEIRHNSLTLFLYQLSGLLFGLPTDLAGERFYQNLLDGFLALYGSSLQRLVEFLRDVCVQL